MCFYRYLAIAGALAACNAATINLTYDEAVGNIGGLPSDAVITWSSVFDLSSHPASPFVDASSTPAGLILLNAPTVFWSGDVITSIQPANFRVDGVYHASESVDDGFPPCAQPCEASSAIAVSFIDVPTGDRTLTADMSSITGSAVPEPSAFWYGLMGLTILIAPICVGNRQQAP